MFRRPSTLLGLLLLSLSACSSFVANPPSKGPTAAERLEAAKAEEAQLATVLQELNKPKADYRIGPADLLDITVYQDKDLTGKTRVTQGGTISLPLVGAIKVGGLTVLEAQESIEHKLKRYYISPQVTLFIEDYGNKLIYVLGEVNKPGSYPIPTEAHLTALEAISIAGGFTPIAAKDRTKILRNVNGQSVNLIVDVTAITKRGEKDKDVILQPNDVIFVPQSFF